jgi:hypothetical protein
MNRVRTLLFPLLVSLAAAAGSAAPAADQRASSGPAALSGSYNLTFTMRLDAIPQAGSVILCKARIAPNLPGFQNLAHGMAPAGSATGIATFSGNAALCSVQIPFSWAAGDIQGGVALSYEIDAVSAGGSLPAPVRAQQGIALPYPAAGTASSVAIRVN